MGAPKGHVKAGGRAKGTPNKATVLAREAITLFVDSNSARLEDWLVKIEKKHGAKAAFESFVALVEFAVPKLARTELTGPGNGPIRVFINRDGQYHERLPAPEPVGAKALPGQPMAVPEEGRT